jgi:hypothetical protein
VRAFKLGILLWRFLSGHHIDGVRRSNSTWNKRGTMPRDASKWAKLKRRHRAMVRWAILAFIAFQLVGVLKFRTLLTYLDFALIMRELELSVRALWFRLNDSHIMSLRITRNKVGNVNVDGLTEEEERYAIDHILPADDESELPDVILEGLEAKQ